MEKETKQNQVTNKNTKKNNPEGQKPSKFNYYWIYGIIAILLFMTFFVGGDFLGTGAVETTEKTFRFEMLESHDVEKIVIVNDERVDVYLKEDAIENEKYEDAPKTNALGENNVGPHYYFTIPSVDVFMSNLHVWQEDYAPQDHIVVKSEHQESIWKSLSWFLPIILLVALWIFMMRRVSGGIGGAGSQIFNIGKSKATLFDQNSLSQVTFNDVAGLDEAKEEVMEVVNFLRDPKKYTRLGGKIPKGVLLIGPPGTGKTLLAKAMAGEAKVPFFSISGSDFVEMFVGVGASRVRDLFKQARSKAPCIIFIDEIDAIGRSRGKNVMAGNDERENTLNQLLVEMDGFSGDKGVILLAATNRPDVLDSALLRPGRFDRQIGMDRPDLKGREQIFKVHIKQLKLSSSVDMGKLAAQTPGFVGADIANVCNEAALIAARKNKDAIEMDDFNDAIDRVIGGLEKKNKIISPDEKEIIAYHEAGHAICGWYLENAHPLVKVSIVPRGIAALGYAQYLPKEKYLMQTGELEDEMCSLLGGRAAEKVFFDKISTGAQNDLDRATKMAYAMVVIYGMTDAVGNISYHDMLNDNGFQKPYSEQTGRIIDEEVKKIIDRQYTRAVNLLTDKYEELDKLAKALLEKEVLFKDDLVKIIGPRPFSDEKEENEKQPAADPEKEPHAEHAEEDLDDSGNLET